jgi:outer membrane protein OmpA-like peptidoglycan-associated protein
MVASLTAAQSGVGEEARARIPLCTGLTLVSAISTPEGDYESIKRVESVSEREIALKLSAQRRVQSVVRNVIVHRTVLRKDLDSATLYVHHFNEQAARTIPGSTALGPSARIFRALKTQGVADLGFVDRTASIGPVDPHSHPNLYDYRMDYSLQRVGSARVPVVVNGERMELPVIHARGDYVGDKAEFYFLDDEDNPLALKYRFASVDASNADAESLGLQVVKISYRCSEATGTQTPAAAANRLERALLDTGRADVYDIYFDFNSDRIREESEAMLAEIADLLRRHPDWKLGIEGHTDSIASDSYNMGLSQRRAAAVVQALVQKQGVSAARLSSSGAGESRPKDRNDTLEGRARNRRVELVRR